MAFFIFIICGVLGIVTGFVIIIVPVTKILQESNEQSKKINEYFQLLNMWMKTKQERKTDLSYFVNKGYKTVGIYGMRELGERLLEELKDSEISVKCIIDQDTDRVREIYPNIPVIHPDESIPEVDVIIVTAFYYFGQINDKLRVKTKCDILSLEEMIYR